ncbi:MAG: sugar phosphate isomerase/epimerase [Candidatus Hydrogenedentes bacterium]|nr:sugar phosphate isomerase/epimerase [Candidatus Hydrogenedentota bacterium]
MRRISIGSWSFSLGPRAANPEPWTDLLSRLKQLGFDGIEVGGFSIHPRPENQPTKEARERIRQEAAGIGMAFSSYIPDLWSERLIDTADPSAYIRAFRKGVEFAADIGAKAVCIDTLHPPAILDEIDYGTAKDRVVSTWKTCAQCAAEHGCYVAWEFEPVYVFNKPSEIVQIVDEIDEDNFGILFDSCHAEMIGRHGAGQHGHKEILEGGCIEFARKLRGKINHIHIIDCDSVIHQDGEPNQRVFGEGTLDFDGIISELEHSGVPHNWWVIDPGLPENPWEVAKACIPFVHTLSHTWN